MKKKRRVASADVLKESRLICWEDLTETVQELLLREGYGRREEAILPDMYKPLALIRLTNQKREILLLEIIYPEARLALLCFFNGKRTRNLGLCQLPLILEADGESLYLQHEESPNQWRTVGYGPLLLIEILEDRPRSKK